MTICHLYVFRFSLLPKHDIFNSKKYVIAVDKIVLKVKGNVISVFKIQKTIKDFMSVINNHNRLYLKKKLKRICFLIYIILIGKGDIV